MQVSIQQSHPSNLFNPSQSMRCNGILTHHARILRHRLYIKSSLQSACWSPSSLLSLSTAYSSFVAHFPTVLCILALQHHFPLKKPNEKSPHDLLLFLLTPLSFAFRFTAPSFQKTNRFYCLTKKPPLFFVDLST